MKRITITIISIVIIILIFIAGFFIGLVKNQSVTIQNNENQEVKYISRDEAINIAKDNLVSLIINKAYNSGNIIKAPNVIHDQIFVENTYLQEEKWYLTLYLNDNGKKGPYDFIIDAEKGKIIEGPEV